MKIKGAMPTTEGIVVPESLADRIDVRCTAKLRDYETKAINLALTVMAQQFAYEKPVIRNRALLAFIPGFTLSMSLDGDELGMTKSIDEHVREPVTDTLLVDIDVDGLCHATLLVGL